MEGYVEVVEFQQSESRTLTLESCFVLVQDSSMVRNSFTVLPGSQ